MSKDRPWEKLTPRQRLARIIRGMRALSDEYEQTNPDWLRDAVLRLLRDSLWNLRQYFDPEGQRPPGQTFEPLDEPFLELQYTVQTDPDAWPNLAWARITEQDTATREDAIRAVERAFLGLLDPLALHILTGGAAYRQRGGWLYYHLPPELWETLEALPEADKDKALGRLYEPFTLGEPESKGNRADYARGLDDAQDQGRPAEGLDFTFGPNQTGRGRIVFQVHPLVINDDSKTAWYPLVVGLEFLPWSDLPDAPAPDSWAELTDAERLAVLDEAWRGIDAILRKGAEESEESTPRGETPETGTLSTAQGVLPTAQRRYLLEGRTRLDRHAAALAGHAGALRLPRKWEAVQQWAELADEKIAVLGPDSPLVESKYRPGPDGQVQEIRTLTAKGEALLLEEIGDKPFVRVLKGKDGIQREYLIRRVPVGRGGIMESRLSWYGLAGLAHEGWRTTTEERLRAELAGLDGTLFANLSDAHRDHLNSRLELLGHVKDAQPVLRKLLAVFGQDGRNPFTIPAWELYDVLNCHEDPRRLERVKGCLFALGRMEFDLVMPGAETVTPRPILFAEYLPGGLGGHGDGDFRIELQAIAIGCLTVFRVDPGKSLPNEAAAFQWNRPLNKDDKKQLRGTDGYIQKWSSVLPHFDAAAELTETQSRLLDWIDGEITLNKDGAKDKSRRYKRTDKGANEPRVYRTDFCPLLDDGKDYNAALGHFTTNPESGRKLTAGGGRRPSKTSGGHPEGLLDVMGHGLKRGPAADTVNPAIVQTAMEDLRLVVEVELGGRVAVFHDGRWFDLDGAATLHVKDLTKKARWLLFVAADWQDRIHQRIEAAHAKRYAAGEADFEVRLTRDREVKRAAEAVRHAAALPAPDTDDPAAVGLDGASLRVRLHAGRTRAGLTVREAAAALGVSGKTISLWERGPEHNGTSIPAGRVAAIEAWLESIGGPGPWNRENP